MIVKTFMGTHLDLSKVVQISDVGFTPEDIGITIDVQLRDQPLIYVRRHIDDRENYDYPRASFRRVDGSWVGPREASTIDPMQLACVANLQAEVDRLVEQWKQSKGCN